MCNLERNLPFSENISFPKMQAPAVLKRIPMAASLRDVFRAYFTPAIWNFLLVCVFFYFLRIRKL